MTLTLQQHFNLIKEGKGNKSQFLRHAKQLFPQYFNQYTNFDTATQVLKSKQIISEAVGGVVGKGFDIWDWKKILAEETKAVEKETSKEVLDNQSNAYDNKNTKNADNVNFNEIMKGFYVELKDPKNAEKTGDELKDMVVKNLSKDPLYYTKNGEFGVKDLGYTTEAPGLGEPKEPKGKYKSSGYGDIEKEIKVKANVQDSLGDKEAKTSMPKKVKEMPDKGVTGAEKKMKLQEGYDSKAGLGKKEQDKISDLSKEEKKALYNDLTDAVANINDKDFKDKALYAKAMKDAKTKVYKKYNILEENQAKETSDEKIVRYEKYTYTLTESVKENTEDEDIFLTRAEELYVDAIDSNNMSEDEAYGFLENQGLSSSQISSIMNYVFPIKADIQEMTEGEQKLRSLIHNIIKEELEEAMYQGPSVKIDTKGSIGGGRRFIPRFTALSKDAIESINVKGSKRLNWEKPHIKIFKTGEGPKLAISQLLLDTIVGSQKGRSKLSLSVSKMGTGITPTEMNELTNEFKKLVKVLSADGKLSKNGEYYLLDVPTKYNEKYNQYEMPLPNQIDESSDFDESVYQQLEDLEDELMNEKDPERKKEIENKIKNLESGLKEAFIDPSGELQDFSSEENKYDIKSFINDIKEKLEYMSIPEVNSFIKNNIKSIKEYYDIMMESNISYGFTPEEFKIHAGALVDSLVRKAATLNELKPIGKIHIKK